MRRIFYRLAIIGLALGACGTAAQPPSTSAPMAAAPTASPPPATVAPTGESIKLLCTTAEDWCAVVMAAAQEQTGIKIVYDHLSSGEALDRLRQPKASPEYDVWFGGPADTYAAAKIDGLLAAYASPTAVRIPSQFKDPDNTWTGLYVGAVAFCSNQAELDKLGVTTPQTWKELENPRLKGHIAMSHPATSGTGYTALWTLVTLNGGDQDKALSFFKGLGITRYTRSGNSTAALVGKGEAAVSVGFAHQCTKARQEGFPDLKVTFPQDGTGYEIGAVALLAGAKNEDPAKRFIDWALSPAAETVPTTANWFILPTNSEAAVPDQSFMSAKLLDYNLEFAGAARVKLAERYTAEIAPKPEN
ncbi:MAG TPA: ABC transporter substrate-binding protein [Herpetosiphonaceae bacterium]|nr:ABC transporter substrate-binding protein [Herpetosiphonaceae bacterium]